MRYSLLPSTCQRLLSKLVVRVVMDSPPQVVLDVSRQVLSKRPSPSAGQIRASHQDSRRRRHRRHFLLGLVGTIEDTHEVAAQEALNVRVGPATHDELGNLRNVSCYSHSFTAVRHLRGWGTCWHPRDRRQPSPCRQSPSQFRRASCH